MKNVMYKIIMGCYIVAALVLVTACNDSLDIQQAYPFSIETLPVPKRLKVGETAEIRCQLVREGYYQPTTYRIRYFQPDGKGKLEMDNGTVFLPNDLYPLEKETFRLYYTSASTDQQTIDIYIIDSFGQMQQLTLFGVFYGLCAGIAAAAGKELYDNFSKKGTPEVWDFIFSVVGVLAGVLNVLLARLVFHFIV